MNKVTLSAAAVAVVSSFAACSGPGTGNGKTQQHFIETQYIDSTVKPGDNFFQFVNGKWLDTVKIPEDKVAVGGFNKLYDDNQEELRAILEDSLGDKKAGSIEQKVGDYYRSGMDTITRDKRGYDPIKPMLASIEAIKDLPSLMIYVADAAKRGDQSIISFNVGPDQKNSSMNIASFHQTGLGLPDRDYYFKTDSSTLNIQKAYRVYLASLFTLTGTDSATAQKDAATVYQIEKQIAGSHKTRVELRDVTANYNKIPVATLVSTEPNIGWSDLLKNLGANGVDSLDVEQPGYYQALNKLLVAVPIDQWKIYLKANTIGSYAGVLSTPFSDAAFAYSKVLTGRDKQEDLWKRMVSAVDHNLGELLGQLYVKKYFPPEAKKRMDQLVTNLETAFSNRIQHLDWMSDTTKATAQIKLKAIVRKIGYPNTWRDYSKVNVDKAKYFENTISARENNYNFQLSQLGKPVDKNIWYMTPPTVNAYYDPTTNQIVFPAGILQYPFFDKDADDAVNYGAIGMVIGHEMTHGFDDQGSQYDKVGNINNWWSSEDKAKFDEKVQKIQKLYDGFTVLDSLHVNGKLTTGENMADFGGVAIAWDAFKLTKQGQDTTKIDGYTPDQRFFMSLAQIWRSKYKDATIRQRINLDPHSPAMWRVLGPLMNFDPFYKAFNVQPGDKMYIKPEDRLKIW
ncbi:putative endopeptidase [Arachidicoccus rhizosphaerae]|uniref:Putative endopeptidase n=1 Tax=Arachidicoccus rhizosphaerae TaxID=551991 RepID=A0A1H3Z9M9_9BACT|nr:M13 family metallopeptidase [Arachidicoccus rhizosphaerae]SEA20042.1 putative endopeptidase [Arachidicoccus rhizosphaerae]